MTIHNIDHVAHKAVIELSSDELVLLTNALYEMEKIDGRDSLRTLHADLIIARDITQYGGLDSCSLEDVAKRRLDIRVR